MLSRDGLFKAATFFATKLQDHILKPASPPSPEQIEMNNPLLEKLVNTPRIFQLKVPRLEQSLQAPLSFYVFGCAGDGKEKQKELAKMLQAISDESNRPDFVVLLGDNFYDDGVDTCNDPAFNEKFHHLYQR